jgi:transcription antitermination factor NusG
MNSKNDLNREKLEVDVDDGKFGGSAGNVKMIRAGNFSLKLSVTHSASNSKLSFGIHPFYSLIKVFISLQILLI